MSKLTELLPFQAPDSDVHRESGAIGGLETVIAPSAQPSLFQHLVLGPVTFDARRVSVASARSDMPRLVRATSDGDVFLIYNAKNDDAPTAILVSPDVLRQQITSPRLRRNLRDLVDALPFKRRGAPRLRADLPDDEAPPLRLSIRSEETVA